MLRVTRLVSLALAMTLGGAPVVAATCAALCAQVSHHASSADPAPQVAAAGHHHQDHGVAPASLPSSMRDDAVTSGARAVTNASTPAAGATRACCNDADDAPARPVRTVLAGRADGVTAPIAIDIAAPEASTRAFSAVSSRSAAAHAPVPVQTRTIAVLRI